MKKLLLTLILILLPLTSEAAKEVTITDYDGSQIQVQIPDIDYNIMTRWNEKAPSLGYPQIKPVPFKGPVGFSIGGKATYHMLMIHNNVIELYVNPNTTDQEVLNYTQLLKQCTNSDIKIFLRYSPNDPRSRQ